jgi:hypothetical protein
MKWFSILCQPTLGEPHSPLERHRGRVCPTNKSNEERERERDRDRGEAYQAMLRPNTKDKFSFLFE